MTSARRNHRAPSRPLPPGAADCHLHVFGPFDRYPLAAERVYNVEEAPLEEHERVKQVVGLERTVLVQASGYGNDNRCLLDALGRLGARGRGVAVLDTATPDRELERLHAAGVRGLRLNLYTQKDRYAGDAARWLADFEKLVAGAGWHLQCFCEPATLVALEPALERARVDIVIDHMGLPEAAAGIGQPGFQALLRLLKTGRTWVKLAGADRVARASGELRDAAPYMQALVAARPDRLVWGSDWPNIGFHARGRAHGPQILPYRPIDAGELLDVLIEAVPDAATRAGILAGNPQRLYGF